MATLQEASVTTFDSIEIRMAVGNGHTWTDCRGKEFAVEYVQHVATVHNDRLQNYATAYGHVLMVEGFPGEPTNASTITGEPLPDWLPTPPPEFTALVDVLRTAVES